MVTKIQAKIQALDVLDACTENIADHAYAEYQFLKVVDFHVSHVTRKPVRGFRPGKSQTGLLSYRG